jgi:hypothetical protein
MSDAGVLAATSIALFSTGHWIGGCVAGGLALAVIVWGGQK